MQISELSFNMVVKCDHLILSSNVNYKCLKAKSSVKYVVKKENYNTAEQGTV